MISFALTQQSFLAGNKTVTRRLGWRNLEPGQQLKVVKKAMGLKLGEKPVVMGVIEVLGVTIEPLSSITQCDVHREGFDDITATEFIQRFANSQKCEPFGTEVTRIEFKVLEFGDTTPDDPTKPRATGMCELFPEVTPPNPYAHSGT